MVLLMKERRAMVRLIEPTSASHIEAVRELWKEYWDWLDFEPCFQDFDREVMNLPGEYGSPDGCMVLAMVDSEVAGCVALRRLENNRCEMKRLYVRPTFRGHKVGFSLAAKIVDEGRKRGYTAMRLDTLPRMEKAIAIYEALGFREVEPYTEEPIDGAKYLELSL